MIHVIDASVGVKWFIDEPGHESAKAVLEKILRNGIKAAVPELFFYEVFSVCMRRHSDPDSFAQSGLGVLESLPMTRLALTSKNGRTAAEFVKLGLTGYDAVYASLAAHLQGKWLTFDQAAAKRIKRHELVETLV